MAVYVISHNDALKSRFQSVIRVVKEDGVSRVVL
jgi:DNA repair exonuclease SbcCD ATPase subunit